ncbi:MAG: nuclear transport factor 2 family protein [Bacteroidetes bacterium]|nr:nuclear transport factor 2 family protein [Bacteroidota bacterium]
MKLKFIILFLSIATLSFSQDDKGRMEIMMKMLTLKNALVGKDSVALSKVLADDVTYGHTNAMIQTKAELIRDVVSLVQDYKSIEPSDMKIRLYDNTAIVNMNSKVVMNYQNYPLELSMKITLTWIKKDKDWQLVARQAVKIQ